jgi:hypothetical protein
MRLASISLCLSVAAIGIRAEGQGVRLSRGLVITRSTRIVKDTYRLPANESADSAIIVIRGDNIVVDFAGATLAGTPTEGAPDEAKGVAIRIDGGRNVRIVNANIRGYKIGILARGTRNLELSNNNLSYNWKPRLYSGIEHESLMDWLSHHNNEKDEWMRYGAAIYLTDVKGGTIKGNRIEHGQNNEITANRFLLDSTAIRLWAVPEEPSDWGYPKHRDTHSRDYQIERNLFVGNRTAIRVAQTANAHIIANEFLKVDSLIVRVDSSELDVQRSDTSALHGRIAPEAWPPEASPWTAPKGIVLPKPLAGGLDRAKDPLAKLPRSAIIVDEWGPYDYRYPKLWPRDTSYATPLALQVLGPRGRWRVISQNGVSSVSKVAGRMNDTIEVVPARGFENDWTITLEYRGPGGSPRAFSYSRFNPVREWDVAFYALADSVGQRTPLATVKTPRLDWTWYRPQIAGLPQANFRMEAKTEVNLRNGSYQIRTISDDAMRVWVDDKLVIDNWKPHESEVNTAPISSGRHTIRVEYYQLGGWVEIRAEIIKR